MSGQFFRINITQREINAAIAGLPGATLSAAAHLHVGWTAASRAVLTNIEAGIPPANRAGLPPHKYLEIPSRPRFDGKLQNSTWLFSDAGSRFCEKLARPTNISKGLNAAGGAQAEWDLGRLKNALAIELEKGNVSIEIYRVDGVEV